MAISMPGLVTSTMLLGYVECLIVQYIFRRCYVSIFMYLTGSLPVLVGSYCCRDVAGEVGTAGEECEVVRCSD